MQNEKARQATASSTGKTKKEKNELKKSLIVMRENNICTPAMSIDDFDTNADLEALELNDFDDYVKNHPDEFTIDYSAFPELNADDFMLDDADFIEMIDDADFIESYFNDVAANYDFWIDTLVADGEVIDFDNFDAVEEKISNRFERCMKGGVVM